MSLLLAEAPLSFFLSPTNGYIRKKTYLCIHKTKLRIYMNIKIKRFALTLLATFFAIMSFALSKDSANAVTMVSYEQGWLDNVGTLALKNNTDGNIHNVTFQITYLNMSGEPLDYQVYSKRVEIAPGMTKQIDIPAYEHDRDFSYYKSEANYIHPHKFKIKFELQGYNQEASKSTSKVHTEDLDDDYDVSYGEIAIVAIVIGLLALSFTIGLYVLVVVMAQQRNRNPVIWVVVSLFTTPILAIIILLCLGKSYDDSDVIE